MRYIALATSVLAACASSQPTVDDGQAELGSAGTLTPPKKLCELVRPQPNSGEVASWADGLAAAGLRVPPAEEGNDAGCALDTFQCRAMHVSIFPTDDLTVQHVGFDDDAGQDHLIVRGFGEPDDGTCGASEAAHFDTVFGGPIAVASRVFSDCQSAADYHDWLVFDTSSGDLVGHLSCQGTASLTVGDDGATTVTCLGKTFKVTRDAVEQCYAG